MSPVSFGKGHSKVFQRNPVKYPGEVVHSDLTGPFPLSLDGAKHACTFMDQFSRFTHSTGLAAKSDALEATEVYKQVSHVQKFFPKGVERLHTDDGGEYKNVDFMKHSETTPHTPQHNPFSEHFNRTFFDPIRTMLEQAGLSGKYWEYAMDYTVYVKNRIYHRAIDCSPYEKLAGSKPNLKHVRTFGCAAFVFENDPKSLETAEHAQSKQVNVTFLVLGSGKIVQFLTLMSNLEELFSLKTSKLQFEESLSHPSRPFSRCHLEK